MSADLKRPQARTWSKGSARGEGPQKSAGVVMVGPPARYVSCADCGSMKPARTKWHAALMHSSDVGDESHPRCVHGVPYYRTCRRVVPPPCCDGEVGP